MTRYKIAQENIHTSPGTFFELGALKIEQLSYPVVWSFGWDTEDFLGTATELKREDDESITAEIEWVADKKDDILVLLEKNDAFLTVYGNNVVQKDVKMGSTKRRVVAVTLRAVSVVPGPDPWLEMQ